MTPEELQFLSDETDRLKGKRGIYEKFRVERTDGRSAPGEKHEHCRYFVLDLDHDPHAISALRAYSQSAQSDEPKLAIQLIKLVGQIEEQAGQPEEGTKK